MYAKIFLYISIFYTSLPCEKDVYVLITCTFLCVCVKNVIYEPLFLHNSTSSLENGQIVVLLVHAQFGLTLPIVLKFISIQLPGSENLQSRFSFLSHGRIISMEKHGVSS